MDILPKLTKSAEILYFNLFAPVGLINKNIIIDFF